MKPKDDGNSLELFADIQTPIKNAVGNTQDERYEEHRQQDTPEEDEVLAFVWFVDSSPQQ